MLALSRSTMVAALCCCLAGLVQAQTPSIPTTEAGGGPQRTTALNGRVFRALIQPMNNSTVTGNVLMQPGQEMGMTTIIVSIVGANPGTYYWHVHVGPCNEPGALLGERSQYRPIKVDDSGRGTVRETISLPPPSGGNYHVIIHETNSPTDEGHIVACGELLETGV
jgi:hypothetical protein